MKLCSDCPTSAWPFAMVTVIAAVLGFITWLMAGLSDLDLVVRLGTAAAVFAAVEVTLVHYVLTCIRRHCRHEMQFQAARVSSRA